MPLDWLAAGDRSAVENDPNPAAAYIRRPVQHVPVISFRSAALLARDMSADPHSMAEDYIPVTAGALKLFALFMEDEAVNLAFPRGTLVVIDYGDHAPAEGAFCLVSVGGRLILRRWCSQPAQFEPASTEDAYETVAADSTTSIIGCARVSIRFH